MVCTDWSITWSSLIPSMEFLASPIWLRSIREEVANPGVIVPGATDMAPGYGVMKPPRAWGTGNEWKGERANWKYQMKHALTHFCIYSSLKEKSYSLLLYTQMHPPPYTPTTSHPYEYTHHTPHTTHYTPAAEHPAV